MRLFCRPILCAIILLAGIAAQARLDRANQMERPRLRHALTSIPTEFGDWTGWDEPVSPDIIARAQATQWLNRVYRNRTHPELKFTLWLNYSEKGTNLRHTPEICLPSSGWTKIESQTKVLSLQTPSGRQLLLTCLGYSQGELVEQVGFWYYIFGEGSLEKFVRQLPITSRSSHGRTTRGSSMTVEIFAPGDNDPDATALQGFARSLLVELEPVLPFERAEYYTP